MAKKVKVKRGSPKKAAKKPIAKSQKGEYAKIAKLIMTPRYPERVPKKSPEPEEPKVEVSVRNVYYDGQYLPALCFRKPGVMHVPCVAGDPVLGVRKFTIQSAQHDKSTVLQHGYGNFAAPYAPERFAQHMRTIAGAAPVTPEARALLLPYVPDMPAGPAPAELPPTGNGSQPVAARMQPDAARPGIARDGYGLQRPARSNGNGAGAGRTSGKELIRALATAAKLPPEKIRAKLRAAGMRAPYTDEAACRKALGVAK